MRLLVLLLASFAIHAAALDETLRQSSLRELPDEIKKVIAAHGELNRAGEASGIPVPPGLAVLVATRRVAAEEWIKRLAEPTTDGSDDEVKTVLRELRRLRDRMSSARSTMNRHASIAGEWRHAKDTPESQRYRAFLRAEVERMLPLITADVADMAYRDNDHRMWNLHDTILDVLEARLGSAEEFPLVQEESPVMRQYLEQGTRLRAIAERELVQAPPDDDDALERERDIFSLLQQMAHVAQRRAEYLPHGTAPRPNSPAMALAEASMGEERALRDLIAHRRAIADDEPAWRRKQDGLVEAHELRASLTGIASDVAHLDQQITEQRQLVEELSKEVPPVFQVAIRARLAEFDQGHDARGGPLLAALADGSHLDAVRAKAAWALLQCEVEGVVEECTLRRYQAAIAREWRDHAAEPGVAAALARLDATWSAMSAAHAQKVADDRAFVAILTAEEVTGVERRSLEIRRRRHRDHMNDLNQELGERQLGVPRAAVKPP